MTWPSTLPTILPLLILTPSKTSPFIQISFNFSFSFLSSSACFLVRSGEIKMSLNFSEFESFQKPLSTWLPLTPSSNSQVDSYQCLQYHSPQPPSSSTHWFYPSPDTASKSQVPNQVSIRVDSIWVGSIRVDLIQVGSIRFGSIEVRSIRVESIRLG